MTRRLIHSMSTAAATAVAAEWLNAGSGSEVLVLAATRAAADEFVRRAVKDGVLGVHRMTIAQLAAELATEPMAKRELAPVSRLGMEALAARVVDALRRERKLEYFAPVADTPGMARALALTLTELRLEGETPARVAKTGKPGNDLGRLLALYEQELAERHLADLAKLLNLATEVVSQQAHRFVGLPILLLDVPPDSHSHREFLTALAERAPSVLATARSGDDAAIATLEQVLGTNAEDIDEASDQTALEHLRRYLFSAERPPGREPDPSVETFSQPGEGLESVEITRRIRKLSEQGMPFDRTAILLRSPERYQPLVEEALRRAGIPGYFSRGTARPDPAGRAFLALLACAEEGCSASRFSEYLSLGQVPQVDVAGAPQRTEARWIPPDDEVLASFRASGGTAPALEEEAGSEPVDADAPVVSGTLRTPAAWEKLLVDAAVIGGHDRWAKRLKGLEEEFRRKLEAVAREDEGARQYRSRQLELLKNLERFALPLIDLLSALPKYAPWGEWLEKLTELAERALRRPETVVALLDELQPMADVGPVDLDEVYGVLEDRLRFLRREPPTRRYGRVFVGSIEEARGREFDVVFLPGLAEGLFPRRPFEDPLLLDIYRERLGGLRRKQDRAAEERLLLRTAAAAAVSKLVISYPRMETTQARPRVPSFYALEVPRAVEGRLPDLRQFEKKAAQAAPARLNWPAPHDAADAVDDAEYDLAALEGLGDRTRRLPKGSGRYLVEANGHLARSLRMRWKRWKNTWADADGIVDPDGEALEALKPHRLAARSYSPSALQQYAACPYRFLLYGVHGLRVREEAAPLEQMDPLTRGGLFHGVQFALFGELKKQKRLPIATQDLQEILDIADRVLERVAGEWEEQLAPAIPRVWKTEVEDLRSDLRGWIRHVAAADPEWVPAHFEYAFGLGPEDGRDAASTREEAVIADGARLRGSVDLVERHRLRGVLRVTDHKTGKPPERIPLYVGGGTLLQPLLYGLAVERLLDEKVEVGRLFYSTHRGGYLEIDIAMSDAARMRAQQVLATIDEAIRTGFLPAAPHKDVCDTCDYRPVCGPYEALRVRRKPQERLEDLQVLRGIP